MNFVEIESLNGNNTETYTLDDLFEKQLHGAMAVFEPVRVLGDEAYEPGTKILVLPGAEEGYKNQVYYLEPNGIIEPLDPLSWKDHTFVPVDNVVIKLHVECSILE